MRYLRVLGVGTRLALLGRPMVDRSALTPGMIWLFALLGALLSFGLSYVGVEPPRRFEPDALRSESFDIAVTLLAGFALARAFAAPRLTWRLPVLLIAAGPIPLCINYLVSDNLLPRWADDDARVYYAWYGVMLSWWAGILYQALTVMQAGEPAVKRLLLSVLTIGLTALLAHPLQHERYWQKDLRAEYEQRQRQQPAPLVAESVLVEQPALLEPVLAGLQRGQPGLTELYFIGFGGDGSQKVFQREVEYVADLFRRRFGAAGRSLALVNDREQPLRQPMASVSNLERAIEGVAMRMNLDEDILFLFITSHGSRDHELAIRLSDMRLWQLSSARLAELLDQSGVRWRVIVISGCYSGGFIEPLKNPYSLVITSARADRSSFGCHDTADLTYFGRAYFEQALAETVSFTEAFRKAQLRVRQWETRDQYTHSEPQMAVGEHIEAKLAEWQAVRVAAGRAGQSAPAAGMLESPPTPSSMSGHAQTPGL